ncbi:hypothetical protein ACHAXS_002396 [Conticribra weissflogii]
MRGTKIPGTPSFGIVCPINKDEKISSEKQKLYHSGVEMLLYLVKHLRPDITYAVRELSKVLDGANMAAYMEMHQVVKYVVDTRDLGLPIEPIQGSEQPGELMSFSDNDYVGDPDSRRGISGCYVCGVPISWRSKLSTVNHCQILRQSGLLH